MTAVIPITRPPEGSKSAGFKDSTDRISPLNAAGELAINDSRAPMRADIVPIQRTRSMVSESIENEAAFLSNRKLPAIYPMIRINAGAGMETGWLEYAIKREELDLQ